MKKKATVLAFDLGASSGRAIRGVFTWEEIHRFENNPREAEGHFRWNFEELMREIRTGIEKAGTFDSVAFDTWGVDFVLLDENLNRIGLTCFEPKGAFYVFPDIRSTGLTSNEFCERFLREERVAVIPGSAFGPGGEGFVRACYAASMKDISEAITRMDNFLTNLRKKQAREG